MGSTVRTIQTTLLASQQRSSALGSLGRSARPLQRSDVSTSTHRPYCSVYNDPPQTPPPEGCVSAVHPLGQWLFDDVILIFFSVNF